VTPLSQYLTDEQRKAVEAKDGAYVLVAPPGSGKTEVLVQRAIWLIETSPEETFRVLALTFTNKAAEALRTRVAAVVGDEDWRVTAATFHAFCFEMLQNYGEPVGVKADVTVYENDEDRAEALLRGLVDDGLSVPASLEPQDLRGVLARIDRLKVDLITPDHAPDVQIADMGLSLKDVYEAYENALMRFGAIDFNGILLSSYQLLLTDDWVASHYRRMYQYIMVDEGQDTNLAQYEILRALCGSAFSNVYIAADENQSIFAFTGASPRYVQRFEEEFSAQRLTLTLNFRSAEAIVQTAERLAAHLRGEVTRRSTMVSAAAAPGWIGGLEFFDERAEGEAVTEWISGLLANGLSAEWLYDGEDPNVSPEGIAVIGRTRYSFDHVTRTLDRDQIGYTLRTEEGGLFDSILGRAVFFSLRIVSNPRDVPSRRRLASLFDRQEELDPAVSSPAEFFRALETDGMDNQLASIFISAGHEATSVDQLIPRLASLSEPISENLDQLEAETWLKDVRQLEECWHSYKIRTRPDARTLAGFLLSINRLQRTTVDDPGVRVLTPYRAKGLEFRAVVILGMNEGTFPFYRSLGSDREVDEERRSVYVAMTRSERALLFTRPLRQQTRYGTWIQQSPSRFLLEMGVTTSYQPRS
jgi:DNA helicase II / ATP-dependent DNA helicase PcrA